MYVQEWIKPQIHADDVKQQQKTLKAQGGSTQQVAPGHKQTSVGGPPNLQASIDANQATSAPTDDAPARPSLPLKGPGYTAGPAAPWLGDAGTLPTVQHGGERWAGKVGPQTPGQRPSGNEMLQSLQDAKWYQDSLPGAGAPAPQAPWKDLSDAGPSTTGFGKQLGMQSRAQARSPQAGGPSLLGALPAPGDRVGPSAPRRPAGMDPRKRGTWNQPPSNPYE